MKSEAVTTLSGSGDSTSSPALEGTMQSGGVFLIPKPSDDPRDPLVCINFSQSDSMSICAIIKDVDSVIVCRIGHFGRRQP